MSDQSAFDLFAAARAEFGDLSASEEKVLHAVIKGDVAYCGPNERNPDSANDPAKAEQWGKDRTVRARLIRWLCVDGEASKHVDPGGIQIHGARIGDSAEEKILDLNASTIAFPLAFTSCKFEVPLNFMGARLHWLSLDGCHIPAMTADGVSVTGPILLRDGFYTDGKVSLVGADIGAQLDIDKAHFADNSQVIMQNATVKQAFFWRNLGPDSPVSLDVRHASIGSLGDEEASWPRKGNLELDGFVYQSFGEGPTGADKRLEWLARQSDGFVPQPYRQLAKVLREAGDDAGAREVLISMEDARLSHGSLTGSQRAVRNILRLTVGYGYKPFRALWWIALFVFIGTLLFSWGKNSNVIVHVDGKNAPSAYQSFNPFIYSLENFIPLLNLRMAAHWMPDANAQPTPLLIPFTDQLAPAPPSLGRYIRWYLWLHILLGWFFTSMLVAGITGLVRRE